ncbi:hypothetical protein ABZV91_28275 [Nocardia sp. NPDC004568]|uniref:hypothetical protein n=1 Tax=Nocardia sp. NPDC004568 TaxID=3154551 RepID=UPI0033B8F29B
MATTLRELNGFDQTPATLAGATVRSPAAEVSAVQLHRSALATIADLYGIVVLSAADLGRAVV